MPESKKFRDLKANLIKEKGKKAGTQEAHAIAEKKGWRH